MDNTRIALVSNAPLAPSLKSRISKFPFLVAVDGGANHCREMGLTPDLILGDFDSIDPSTLNHFSGVPQEKHPQDKDKTDLELALERVFHPLVEEVVVFGALQGRTDHSLGNLILLSRYPGKLFFESEQERLFIIDRQVTLSLYIGQTLSLIPLNGPVKGINTQGLKWELREGALDKHFIGISNEALSTQVFISVKTGDLLCCLNFQN
ncbi:MAG: thiamine diphosphokinase [Candidatus Melainabacteria bacterium]|nr:thiamine diphosphokinase [Candidatus Melainabacteria bacterium]